MKVALATIGSRGDLQPFVALARRLIAAGHEVRVFCTQDGQALCDRHGLPFISLGGSMEELLAAQPELTRKSPLTNLKHAKELVRTSIHSQLPALRRELPWADVVVGAGLINAASSIAEAQGIPYFYAAFSGQALPSRLYGPYTVPTQGLPGVVNTALWRLNDALLGYLARDEMNAYRAELGLPSIASVTRTLTPPGKLLFAADPEITSPPLDYDPRLIVTGSWTEASEQTLPRALEAFLSADPRKPVYVGFGSMTDGDPAATTRLLVDAVREVGVRCMLSAGWAKLGQGVAHPDLLVLGDVPHTALFPRAAGIVHHGGAGTLAAAARAGVPQLVVPHINDQFYAAERVYRRGLGPLPIPRTRLTRELLVVALRQLVRAESARAARDLARELAQRDGTALAMRAIEKAAREAPPRRSHHCSRA